ncbi:MAG: hypothetical protein HQL56_16530 [Magnetococcales bacterium]|nr:hypothetical protein [Magnetococcales bacterium]
MGQLVIHDVDEAIIERLRARAASQHISLEFALREMLSGVMPISAGEGLTRSSVDSKGVGEFMDPEIGAPFSREERVAEMKRIRAMLSPNQSERNWPSAEFLIREDRDNNETYR